MKSLTGNKRIRNLLLFIVVVFFLSGLSGMVFERVVLPNLSTWPFLRRFPILSPRAPVVITKIEEVRIDEGINQAELASRLRNSIVTVYVYEGTLGSGKYRILAESSGFVLTRDGLIGFASDLETARDGVSFSVLTTDGRVYKGENFVSDRMTGLSFVRVKGDNFSIVRQGASAALSAGEKVLTLFSPNGSGSVETLPSTVMSAGVPDTGLTMERGLDHLNAFLRLDRELDVRSLGGIVVDKTGQMVGVVARAGRGAETRVVRTEDLDLLLDKLLGGASVSWPSPKIVYEVLSPGQAEMLGFPKKYGVLVKTAAAPLRSGDFVYAIDSQDLSPVNNFQFVIFSKNVGQSAHLSIVRAGVEKEVEIDL